ncbi:hypothetical protein ASD65_05705 [Microbacterium sp. Root61]|uniref:hypothetical protein n=1 Tax=Microbacterium sp. Root61 TaxID=1736570 RepID=UPI0006F6C984|nr:hypothetical protein [Microbacterium sp. Root61]KRA23972.1 hypothetical protein ASD65_05705 [Microbacterium sp. Root61]
MTDSATRSAPDRAAFWAGIALIVLPLLAVVIKFTWMGWLALILVIVSPGLAVGYALQVVIAANGLLRPRGVLRAPTVRRRALLASWLSAGGVLVGAFFMVDGGDQDWGSAFMYIVGAPGNVALGDISTVISLAAGLVWIGGWLWLVIEWIAAHVRARAANRAVATV